MEQLERLRLKHGLKQVSQPARWASSAILISIAAGLLLLVVRAKLQGADIPRVLVGVVAISFFAATFSGTYFLVRALREYRESEERFRQNGEQYSRDLLDDRRTNKKGSLRERSVRNDHRTIMFLVARQSNLL